VETTVRIIGLLVRGFHSGYFPRYRRRQTDRDRPDGIDHDHGLHAVVAGADVVARGADKTRAVLLAQLVVAPLNGNGSVMSDSA
jgi:hypothetical protein